MPVDWRMIQLKAGDWTCPQHGPIIPSRRGLVPHCDTDVDGHPCMRVALVAVAKPGQPGVLHHTEPRPRTCRHGHQLGPGRMTVGWRGCQCTPAGGHRTWTCNTCPTSTDPHMWPPACD